MRVYVATVDTRDEIMGVGATRQEAIDVACEKALDYLLRRGITHSRTIEQVAEYFGVGATAVEVGTATFTNH